MFYLTTHLTHFIYGCTTRDTTTTKDHPAVDSHWPPWTVTGRVRGRVRGRARERACPKLECIWTRK